MYSSVCQLFELFLLAVFRAFSDVPLADIVGETPTGGALQQQPAPQPEEVGHICDSTFDVSHSLSLTSEPALYMW